MSYQQPERDLPVFYKGLEPFSEDDARIFFGRTEERDRLVYSLQSSRLTILYGAKQVGKTSLVRAGVAPQLRRLCGKQCPDVIPESAVVIFSDWSELDVINNLMTTINAVLTGLGVTEEAIQGALAKVMTAKHADMKQTDKPVPEKLPPDFLDYCRAWTECLGDGGGELFILLDQFADYLLSHPRLSTAAGSFDAEFARVVSTKGLAVNFLIAIRDDLLASLDRYRHSIPTAFESLIRIEALTKNQAIESIRNPLFLVQHADETCAKVGIEPELIQAVLDSARLDRDPNLPLATEGSTASDVRYDASAIQLAMKRVWDFELKRSPESRQVPELLSKAAFEELGGIFGIAMEFVETRIAEFTPRERYLGGRIFGHLITPGGMGVAYPLSDLAREVDAAEDEIKALLERLGTDGNIIARARGGTPDPGSVCYEIVHRVLTPAILDRVRKYNEHQIKEENLLESAISKALRIYEEASQLGGLNAIVAAAEDLNTGVADGLVPGKVGEKLARQVGKSVKSMLDGLCQQAELGGYTGAVTRLAFSRDGRWLVSGSEDGAVTACDLHAPKPAPKTYRDGRHSTWVWGLRVSRDGQWMATGSDDGNVLIWRFGAEGLEPAGAAELAEMPEGGSRQVRGLGFHPDDPVLAIATTDGYVHLWHLAERRRLMAFPASDEPVRCVEYSPDGRWLATGAECGRLAIWDVSGEQVPVAPWTESATRHDAGIWDIRWRPAGGGLASCSEDHTIKLWRFGADGAQPGLVEEKTLAGHTCWVLGLDYSPDGEYLASASEDGTARVWDSDGNLAATYVHSGPVNGVRFLPDPDNLRLATAAADFRVRFWSLVPESRERWPRKLKHAGKAILMDVGMSADGKYAAAGATDGDVQFWDRRGRALGPLSAHTGWVMCVVFHPDSSRPWLASGSTEGRALVWDIESRQVLAEAAEPQAGPMWSLAFSPKDRETHLATASHDGIVRIWDYGESGIAESNGDENRPPRCRLVACFPAEHGPVWSVRYSPDGAYVAAGYKDGSICFWPVDGRTPGTLLIPANKDVWIDGRVHQGQVLGLGFSADGRWLASSSSEGRIVVWDLDSGEAEPIAKLRAPVWSVCFSPGGELLASGSVDRSVRLWHFDGGKVRETFPPLYSRGPIRGISFERPTGDALAAACSDGTVRLWPTRCDGNLDDLLEQARTKLRECDPLIYQGPATGPRGEPLRKDSP